jgi:hypothetical protein
MKYFALIDDVHIPGRWHLGEVVERGSNLPLEELWTGKSVREGLSAVVEITHRGTALDFCLTSFAVPVAKAKLAHAIALVADSDLQPLPVEVPGHRGFAVLNSVRLIQCLDEKRSEFMKWTEKDHRADLAGQYRMVTKLKIDGRQVPADAHFFRIEGWPIALIISEQVKSAMETTGCLGAKFEDVT